MELVFDKVCLGEILKIASIGLAEYKWKRDENCILTSKYTQGCVTDNPCKVLKREMVVF